MTTSISKWLKVTESPFKFSILDGGKNPKEVYYSNSSKLFMSENLVLDSVHFAFNLENLNPLFGMGERSGPLFYEEENGGVHSRWNYGLGIPGDFGRPPGRNTYGIQPFYMFESSN